MKLSISKKFQLLTIPLVLIGLLTFWVAQEALRFNSSQLEAALETKSLSNRLISLLYVQQDSTKAILLNPDLLVEYSDRKIKAFDESTAIAAQIKELSKDPQMHRLVEELETIAKKKLQPRDSMVLEKLFDGEGIAIKLYFSPESSREYQDFEAVNNKIFQLAAANAVEAKRLMEKSNRDSLMSIGISLGAGVLITLLIMLVLIHRVSSKMLSVSTQINQGAQSLNTAQISIKGVSSELRSISNAGKTKIASAVSSVMRINENEKFNVKEARRASDLTVLTQEQTNSGAQTVANLSQQLVVLKQKMQGIAQIVDIMNGIAFQTNILSLNAAVEAARAGEQGRGFGIVASAVRELANRSKDSASKVSSIINEGLRFIQEIEKSMGVTHRSFQNIAEKVEGLSQLVQNIAQANHKQATDVEGVQEVLLALGSFSELMNRISSNLEQQSEILSQDFVSVDRSAVELSAVVRGA